MWSPLNTYKLFFKTGSYQPFTPVLMYIMQEERKMRMKGDKMNSFIEEINTFGHTEKFSEK